MRLLPRDPDLSWTPYAWLIYIVPFTITPLYTRSFANARGWMLFAGATLVFLPLYFRAYWARGRELILIASATAALGVAFWPLSYGAGALFIYAASMLGTLEPPKHAVRGVLIASALVPIEAYFIRRDVFSVAWPLVFSLIVGGINVHFSQVGRTNARLRLAHDEIERLAKVAERERIARDLHDLLGHTLSLVILKSELASKLAERDVERARDEIRDVERIARDALTQVRAAVRGYRSGGLEAELEQAQHALSAAGVTFECESNHAAIPPSHEAVLALALREAITNIVRHSGAHKCRITLDANAAHCTLTVSDDGRGGNAPFGNGLTGMRERVELLGGTMTRDGRSGTMLVVTIPLPQPQAAERSA